MAVSVARQLNLAFLSLLVFSVFQKISGASLASQFLDPQNRARANVSVGALSWNEKLAEYASGYAQKRKTDCALKHSGGPYGENIFWGSGSSWKPADAVASWVREDRYFNYNTHSCDDYTKCGHYAQIIWKSTLRVGCASVKCSNGNTFIICSYDPRGNIVGQKAY